MSWYGRGNLIRTFDVKKVIEKTQEVTLWQLEYDCSQDGMSGPLTIQTTFCWV